MTKTDGVPFHEMPTVISDSEDISDSGWVRIGNASPPFPMMRPLVPSRPITISSSSTADEPNVRIAAVSPTFAPVRSR
jgi:hypothetical protein